MAENINRMRYMSHFRAIHRYTHSHRCSSDVITLTAFVTFLARTAESEKIGKFPVVDIID